MRTIVLLCSLVAGSGSLATQQIVDHHPQETEATASNGSTPDGSRRQVLDLEKEWVTAELKHDANTLRRILDDKFLASFEAGKPYGKDAFIQAIVSGELDPTESQTLTDEQVIIDRDTAVVVGTIRLPEPGMENHTQQRPAIRSPIFTATADGLR